MAGGGLILWVIDSIGSSIRNKKIKKYNQQARGVEEYQATATSALFSPHTYKDSIIISGGS
jgi:hypothetical protein